MPQVQPAAFLASYDRAVREGAIKPDTSQRQAASQLSLLFDHLTTTQPIPSKRGWFGKRRSTPALHGLYLWGDVGRGKTMLMDRFVSLLETSVHSMEGKDRAVRRVHFHAFMRDVHHRLFIYRQRDTSDLLGEVITQLASEQCVLCLDELQVTDVTDAMILSRLFGGLLDAGVVILFTSNRLPHDLYQGGLQREQFLAFADLLIAQLAIVKIDSPEDYRLAQLRAMRQTYMYPRNEASDDFLLETWRLLTHGATSTPLRIEVDGRSLRVDKHADGVAWLTFPELCIRPLGAGDYLEICKYCHTVLLQGIPRLTREDRNEAKRFVTLVDTLYDHRIKVIITAETAPEDIYPQGDGSFEFARTVSRLIEMQSEKYLASAKQ